jgi:flagellar hook-associated protein 1
MLAEEGAMQASTNNLANLNTVGYSRQVPLLETTDPVVSGSVTYGNGVDFKGFVSVRDNILNLRIAEEQQNQSQYESYTNAMSQVQVLFSDASGGIGGALTGFFNSLSALSTQADSTELRQGVLAAAQSLVDSFHSATTTLSGLQSSLDLQVQQAVQQVNQLTTQIAALNSKITGMQKLGQNPGSFIDQREQAIGNLSNLLNVSETQTDEGLTLTTANGVALVVDGQSFSLGTSADAATTLHRVMSGSADVTSFLNKGSLGGILSVRDTEIPRLQASLDQLAANFSSAVNQVHQTGVDLNGNPGTALFSPPPATPTGAAAVIQVNISDPALLAMSTSPASGGNDVANALLALKSKPAVGTQTPLGAYSQIVFQVGSNIANAQSASDTSSSILGQLRSQQSSLSGVSMDEETANLIQFQRGFEAAAHVISVIDSMMQTVLGMGVTQ